MKYSGTSLGAMRSGSRRYPLFFPAILKSRVSIFHHVRRIEIRFFAGNDSGEKLGATTVCRSGKSKRPHYFQFDKSSNTPGGVESGQMSHDRAVTEP